MRVWSELGAVAGARPRGERHTVCVRDSSSLQGGRYVVWATPKPSVVASISPFPATMEVPREPVRAPLLDARQYIP